MTEKEAISILFDCAAVRCRGSGTGMSPGIPSEKDRARITMAVMKLWPKVYRYEFGENDAFRMGLNYAGTLSAGEGRKP